MSRDRKYVVPLVIIEKQLKEIKSMGNYIGASKKRVRGIIIDALQFSRQLRLLDSEEHD